IGRIVLFLLLLLPAALAAQSPSPKVQGEAARSLEPLEIGPFGRVFTCDPQRREGTRISQLTEFPVADLFLENDLERASQGFYQAPATAGQRCIGLSWPEKRSLQRLELEFRNPSDVPDPDKTKVDYWSSQDRNNDDISVNGGSSRSCWQGLWQPLPGK